MTKAKITKHLKLPFQFDEQKLLSDLEKVLHTNWNAHFNLYGYSGDWKSIALYAPNGERDNIYANQAETAPILETELLKNCYYFKEVLSHFKCPILSARLLNLGPGAYIKPHKDHELGYENGCFRIHIPITTNPKVEFILADKLLIMKPGECWYTNVNHTHSVANNGSTDRVHIVLDGQRNKWSDDLFFSLASKESLLSKESINIDHHHIVRTIEELERNKIPGYEQIIAEYKKQFAISENSTITPDR